MSRLVDFDWVVSDIVSSSMCDDHASAFTHSAGGSEDNNNVNSSSNVANESLREPLSRVMRLELLVNELNAKDQTRQIKPHLVELSVREVDGMIAALKGALGAS